MFYQGSTLVSLVCTDLVFTVWWSEIFFCSESYQSWREAWGLQPVSFVKDILLSKHWTWSDLFSSERKILMPTFSFNGRIKNWSQWRLLMLIDNFWRNFSTFLKSTVKICFSSLGIIHWLKLREIFILMIKFRFWLCLTCPVCLPPDNCFSSNLTLFITPSSKLLVCLFPVPKIKMELKWLLNKKVVENLSREQILLMKYLKNKI